MKSAVNQTQKEKLTLNDKRRGSYAHINLLNGATLMKLVLQGKSIIEPRSTKPFASSILFPFPNRIKNGKYTFNGKLYQLEKLTPDVDSHNAIHGLIFNKEFTVKRQKEDEVVVGYSQNVTENGFPFMFNISITYKLKASALHIEVLVKNTDNKPFPFALGWHPYFETSNLDNSELFIKSTKKILVDNTMIPKGKTTINWNGFEKINNQTFDDCFQLNSNNIHFKTPDYQIKISSSSTNNYLQLYTPDDRKSIAIEPQTATANSFNTNEGLQILQPNKVYKLQWTVELEEK